MAKGKKREKAAEPEPVPDPKRLKKAHNKGQAATHSAADTDSTKGSGGSKDGIFKKKRRGFIFMCDTKTKIECYNRNVFRLPNESAGVVEKIKKGAKLFVLDSELKLLYGVYKATSSGGLNLDASAFGGKFPAQVKFKIDKRCAPLPERSFKQAIKENYCKGKFNPKLRFHQVQSLLSLFQPIRFVQCSAIPLVVKGRNRPLCPGERERVGHHSCPPLDTGSGYAPPVVPRLPHDPCILTASVTGATPVMESLQYPVTRFPSQTGAYHPSPVGLPPQNDAYCQPMDLPYRYDACYQPASGMLPSASSYCKPDARIYYPENPLGRYRAAPQSIPRGHPPALTSDYRSLGMRDLGSATPYVEPPSWQSHWAPINDDLNSTNSVSLRRPISSRRNMQNLPVSSRYSFAGLVPIYR
uniref:B2 protein n=1 Tax=Anthurium amnicola TaxID=1678845 RepID=A0A1D1XCX4_9ARAE